MYVSEDESQKNFESLVGEIITEILGCENESECVHIKTKSGRVYTMAHDQECCETVKVVDVCGNPDDLIGHRIALAEVTVSNNEPFNGEVPEYPDSYKWTFYKLRSHGGDLTIRWLGESNGYYSERVDVRITP